MSARTIRAERGLSLVEATIILMVIGMLTAVIAPVMSDYTEDAQRVVAKDEVEAIGTGILRLLRDTGSRCMRLDGTQDCSVSNRVDILVTTGANPESINNALAPDITIPDSDAATNATMNWLPDGNAPVQQDLLEDQLVENDNPFPYPTASFLAGGGPRMKLGWRGAYLTAPLATDPWDSRYQANTVFLTVATNATDGAVTPNQFQEGLREAAWHRDVLVLSAGPNRIVETSFGGAAGSGVAAGGDDVIWVITGASR